MKRKLVKLLITGAMSVMLISSSVSVFARDMQMNNPEVEKVLNVADGITVPQSVFSFTIEKNTVDGPDLHIADVTISEGAENDSDAKIFGYGSILNSQDKVLSVADFPHAGVYQYTISEVNKGDYTSDIDNDTITYDSRSYTFSINVVNTAAGGLEIASMVIKDNSVKSDEPADGKVTSLTFNNTYEKTSSLYIEKQTVGNYADRTKDFDFTITMTAPATSDVTEFTGKIGEETVRLQSGVQGTFKLHDDERLVFDNLPAGTTYVVSEVGAQDGYMASVAVVENGGGAVERDAENDQDGIASSDTTNLIGEGTNSVVFTNTLEDNPATGIIINNLPIVVSVGVLAGGVVLYAIARRKVTK